MRSKNQYFITRTVPLNCSFSIFPTLHHPRGLGSLVCYLFSQLGQLSAVRAETTSTPEVFPQGRRRALGSPAFKSRHCGWPNLVIRYMHKQFGSSWHKAAHQDCLVSLLHTDNSSWKLLHIRMPHLGNIWKEEQFEIFTSRRCTSQYQQYWCFA